MYIYCIEIYTTIQKFRVGKMFLCFLKYFMLTKDAFKNKNIEYYFNKLQIKKYIFFFFNF